MLSKIPSETSICKCCDNVASLYGAVDFNKNCESTKNPTLLPYIGIPVYYYRCPNCHFIFTNQFDDFSHKDFLDNIYNEQYVLVDPDFVERRPQNSAAVIAGFLADNRSLKVLDYGGGNGKTAMLLQQQGYSHVETYDPFSEIYNKKPTDKFDCIYSFEVFEHTTNPVVTLMDVCSYLKPNGLILFSTLLQPKNINELGLNWWYIAPRNGHISIHTSLSLKSLADSSGFLLAHAGDNFHILVREIPDWASHLFNS